MVGIIGAGLTGLLTAYYLKQAGFDFMVFEARDRIGGRIHTLVDEHTTQVEMGATWFGEHHQNLIALLNSLGINSFPQFQTGKAVFEASSMAPVQIFDLPKGQPSSYRIVGGTTALIDRLVSEISKEKILLDQQVQFIEDTDRGVNIHTSENTYESLDLIISTLPPALVANSVKFKPQLPMDVIDLCNETHTWMGNSIKFAVTYKNPFWRNMGFAGVGFSNASIASEIHDHVNYENTKFALKGFLSSAAFKLDDDYRKKIVIDQLERFFGEKAGDFIAYHETLWAKETFTTGDQSNDLVPHQNNGHSKFQKERLNGKLLISGSETSPIYGGYMDGAVYAAELASEWVKSK